MAQVSSVGFGVEIDKVSFKVGEPIMLRLVLANQTQQAVTVNRRLLVYRPAPLEHEVVINLMGPQGEQPFAWQIRAGPPVASDFVTLQPGQRIWREFDLADGYAIQLKGHYSVYARYENLNPPGWVGKVNALPVEFTVD